MTGGEGLANRFAVTDDCAVGGGGHDASQVTRRFREAEEAGGVATAQQLFAALNGTFVNLCSV